MNAEEPTKAPLTYDEAVLVAVDVMETNGCPPVVPLVQNYYDSFAVQDGAPRGRGRGAGEARGGRRRENLPILPWVQSPQPPPQQQPWQHAAPSPQGPWMPHGPMPNLAPRPARMLGVVGKMPGDLKLLRIGNLQVCQRYNTNDGCKNPVDRATGNCTIGNVTRAHLCGITVKQGQNGNNPRLCGSNAHNALTCPQK